MRLSEEEINNIKSSVYAIDKDAQIIVFGSRIDDNAKGGDIDILIISQKINRHDIWRVRDNFFKEFGEQKLDILLDDGSLSDPFIKKVHSEGIVA